MDDLQRRVDDALTVRLGTLEREVNQLHRRFDDQPPGFESLREAFIEDVRRETQRAAHNTRLAVAIVTALAVVAAAAINTIGGHNAVIARQQAAVVADQRYAEQRQTSDEHDQQLARKVARETRAEFESAGFIVRSHASR